MAALIALAGCGGSHGTASGASHASTRRSQAAAHSASKKRQVRLVYRTLFALPAPLRDPATAALGGGRFVLLGGLDAADVSTAGIEVATRGGVTHNFTLPVAQHDAQGTAIGGFVFVFGGGSLTELDHIVSFDPAAGAVRVVGALPTARSDVAVAQLDGTAYVVGGFDGTNWLNTILAWRPHSPVRVAGHLPVGLRYAAVSAVDGRLLIIGGSTPTAASDAIYSFDLATGAVRRIGRLPTPITHGGAATLGSYVYLVGGRGNLSNAQTATVWAIDPLTGAARLAGRLPHALSDAGVLAVDDSIVVAGGLTRSGATASTVGEFAPRGG